MTCDVFESIMFGERRVWLSRSAFAVVIAGGNVCPFWASSRADSHNLANRMSSG